jgi:cytochrome c oxidase subunit 2
MSAAPDRRRWLATAGALALAGLSGTPAQAKVRTIHVVAKKFEFVPGEIRVKRGETVRLRFTAPEVPMGASFPDFGLRTDVMPGKPATLELTADKAGRFTFLCDVFCGSGHEDMNGVLVVEG